MNDSPQPSDSDSITMTQRELREICREAGREGARQAIDEAFTRLGIQSDDPHQMQQDFQHLRRMRLTMDGLTVKVIAGAALIVLTGVLSAIWVGITRMINGE